jgi:hypothetical protein
MKLSILRIDSSNTSDISHRYLITKDFIQEEIDNVQYAPSTELAHPDSN